MITTIWPCASASTKLSTSQWPSQTYRPPTSDSEFVARRLVCFFLRTNKKNRERKKIASAGDDGPIIELGRLIAIPVHSFHLSLLSVRYERLALTCHGRVKVF